MTLCVKKGDASNINYIFIYPCIMDEDQKVFIILVLKFFPWELLFSKENNMSSKKKNKRKRKKR